MKYIYLIKGGSPDDSNKEEVMGKWHAWSEEAKKEGKYLSGHSFEEGGKIITSGGAEDYKSDMGGYMIMENTDEADALSWAGKLPNIELGGSVGVHPVQEMKE